MCSSFYFSFSVDSALVIEGNLPFVSLSKLCLSLWCSFTGTTLVITVPLLLHLFCLTQLGTTSDYFNKAFAIRPIVYTVTKEPNEMQLSVLVHGMSLCASRSLWR